MPFYSASGVDSSEPKLMEQQHNIAPSSPLLKKISLFFSIIGMPLFMSLYGLLGLTSVLTIEQIFPCPHPTLMMWNYIFFTTILPIILLIILKQYKLISNFDITDKDERTLPYFLTSFCFLIFSLSAYFYAPQSILVLPISIGVILMAFLVLISYYWKISAHMAGIGAFVAASTIISYFIGGNTMVILGLGLLASGCLGSSRAYLQVHTLGQIYAGFGLGFILMALPFYSSIFYFLTTY